jgi:hypothetical protein
VATRGPLGTALVVEAAPTYLPERRYVLDVVLREWLGLDWSLRPSGRSDVRIALGDGADSGSVVLPDVLFATAPEAWLTAASLPRPPLDWRPVAGGGPGYGSVEERLPVIYGERPAPPALVSDDAGAVRIAVDVFGSAFFMLTRYEELVDATRDAFGRFPAAASLAYREGFLGLPVVDAYAELLWRALERAWPRLRRRAGAFRLALTHDVDRPLSFLGRTPFDFVRQLGADVLLRRDARLVARRVRSWAGIRHGDHRLDPYNTFDLLMSVSERHGLRSTFNFLATEPSRGLDASYAIEDPWILGLMAHIHERGHEIGFHAGYHTYRDAERTKREFARLRAATGGLRDSDARWPARQHYLRWDNPSTWSNLDAAGIDEDSTLGFADHVGFRAGTCRDFPTFHLRERRPLRLRERPLIVMDGTLFDYMALAPDAAAETVIDLARRCKRHEGTLTLLWHNSSLPTTGERRRYAALIEALANGP